MTKINYDELDKDLTKILAKAHKLVEGINIDKLALTKKKLGMIKTIIDDISKINGCCGKGKGGLDPMMLMMMMNSMKDDDSKEIMQKKMAELFHITSKELSKATTDNLYDETLGKEPDKKEV